ncbi:MAG: DUF4416 family protein [Candidatus Nanoarchaeia archaeon]|nr:DUF4416 family protein [Candidatus Nanoarchaeia archaeon]
MKPVKPRPVKLFCGVLYKGEEDIEAAVKKLQKKFGPIELISPLYDFNFTDYYEEEFSNNLKKKFLVFTKLIDPESIADIKLFTNKIEQKYTKKGKRIFNLDPGYLSLENLILPSAKPRPHRIYLRKGIYADPVYIFTKNEAIEFKHTFPDFKELSVKNFFVDLRKKYLEQLKH